MADVTVNAAVSAVNEVNFQFGPFWTSELIGYAFTTTNNGADVGYHKTTDGGATWGSLVVIGNDAGQNSLYRFHVWYDRDTPGDTGTLCHVVWQEWGDDSVRYRSLDTASDTLGTEVTIASGLSYTPNTAALTAFNCSITKARGGNLYVHFVTGGNLAFYRSTNAGASWASRTTLGEGVVDVALLLPANLTDTQDICAIFDDVSANAISIKVYDDSANTWTETAIASMTENAAAADFAATVRHSDSRILLAFWNNFDAGTADLQTYELTVTATTATVSAKTNVMTNRGESAQVAICGNWATDDVYVFAILGGSTWGTTTNVLRFLSTDDMATWDLGTTAQESAAADYAAVSCGLGVKSGSAGRIQPIWFHDVNNDLLTNKVTSIEITAGGGPVTRTVDGAMPAAAGTLARTLAALRTVAGSQPTSTGVLSRRLAALRALAGSQPTAAGTLARIYQALRSVDGSQPTATGTLATVVVYLRTLAGSQPAPSGSVSRVYAALRSVAGTSGEPSGVVARTAGAFARALTGTAGVPSGTLARVYQALRAVAGTSGAPSGALEYARGLIERTVSGTMGAPSAVLARTLGAVRALAGSQPTATGTLARTAAAFGRTLAGTAGAPSASLSGALGLITRSVAGVMGAPSATLAQRLAALRSLTGTQPTAAGTLARTAGAFARSVAGTDGAPSATLARTYQAVRTLTGAMPTATGVLQSAFGIINRALSGAMGAPSGAVARQLAAVRTLEGIQPAATGIVARTAGAFVRVLAGLMEAASALLTRTHSSETTAVSGSSADSAYTAVTAIDTAYTGAVEADALYGAAVAADSLYVAAEASDLALVGATASDSEG
jgi:hypothetical protein